MRTELSILAAGRRGQNVGVRFIQSAQRCVCQIWMQLACGVFRWKQRVKVKLIVSASASYFLDSLFVFVTLLNPHSGCAICFREIPSVSIKVLVRFVRLFEGSSKVCGSEQADVLGPEVVPQRHDIIESKRVGLRVDSAGSHGKAQH